MSTERTVYTSGAGGNALAYDSSAEENGTVDEPTVVTKTLTKQRSRRKNEYRLTLLLVYVLLVRSVFSR